MLIILVDWKKPIIAIYPVIKIVKYIAERLFVRIWAMVIIKAQVKSAAGESTPYEYKVLNTASDSSNIKIYDDIVTFPILDK